METLFDLSPTQVRWGTALGAGMRCGKGLPEDQFIARSAERPGGLMIKGSFRDLGLKRA